MERAEQVAEGLGLRSVSFYRGEGGGGRVKALFYVREKKEEFTNLALWTSQKEHACSSNSQIFN